MNRVRAPKGMRHMVMRKKPQHSIMGRKVWMEEPKPPKKPKVKRPKGLRP